MKICRFFPVVFLFLLISLSSCRNDPKQPESVRKPGRTDMEELNRYLVSKDRERIKGYIGRKDLEMQELQTGLWYQILSPGEGNFLDDNDVVLIEYECSLLDGTKCYSSDESGPMQVVLGKTGIEPGLDQGLRMLKPGAKAIFILPPFLAHGLPGDGKKIPPRSVVVYNVNILRAE